MAKFTQSDILELAQQMRNARDDGHAFAFLTGAGLSKTAEVPLSKDIIKLIAEKYSIQFNKLSAENKRSYGACMALLTAGQRKNLLDPILKKAKINWAHIALACLVKHRYVNRVLTFNFDSILVRSCGLCGDYPAIYDFGTSPAGTFDHIEPNAIIHLHGQGSGLRMMNSVEETAEHAKKLAPLFAHIFSSSPMVVLGYSGLADGAFPEFQSTFEGRYPLYWADFESDQPGHLKTLFDNHSGATHFHGGADADLYLVALARALNCFPPNAIENYHQHMLDELDPIVSAPTEIFGSSGAVLEGTRTELRNEIENRKSRPLHEVLNDFLMRGDYDSVLARELDAKTDEDKTAVAWAFIMQGNRLYDYAKLTGKADAPEWGEAFAKFGAAIAIKPDMDEAFNNWGLALSNYAKLTGKADAPEWGESFEKYASAIAIKPDDHMAFNNWGLALNDYAKLTGKADAPEWGEAFAKYASAIANKPDKHEALFNWGLALHNYAKLTGKADAPEWGEAFEKYASAIAIKPDKHEAFYNWGAALSDYAKLTGRADAEEWGEAFEKYASAIAIKPDDHMAFNNWGLALYDYAKLTGKADAPEWGEAFAKYGSAIAIKPDKHEAFYNWGAALSDYAKLTGKSDAPEWGEAFAKYASAIAIKPDMHEAFNNWGNALSDYAKLTGRAGAPEWGEAFEKYASAIAFKPDDHEALNNWGNALSDYAKLTGKADAPEWGEAFEKFASAIAIKPDDHMAFNNWCIGIIELWQIKHDAQLLVQAEEKARQAELFEGKSNYNLACIFALQNKAVACREKLLNCKTDGTLPNAAHLRADVDLVLVQGEDWFKEFLESLG